MYRHHKWTMVISMSISFSFFYANVSVALPSDHQEVVHVSADYTLYNYKTGVTTFEGNVKINQGTTHLTADRLVTKNNPERKMEEAVAYGLHHLAHYWTLRKVGEKPLYAEAKMIRFYPTRSDVVLEKQAKMTQGKNSFQGHVIFYNRAKQTIMVPASEHGRAVLIYNPE